MNAIYFTIVLETCLNPLAKYLGAKKRLTTVFSTSLLKNRWKQEGIWLSIILQLNCCTQSISSLLETVETEEWVWMWVLLTIFKSAETNTRFQLLVCACVWFCTYFMNICANFFEGVSLAPVYLTKLTDKICAYAVNFYVFVCLNSYWVADFVKCILQIIHHTHIWLNVVGERLRVSHTLLCCQSLTKPIFVWFFRSKVIRNAICKIIGTGPLFFNDFFWWTGTKIRWKLFGLSQLCRRLSIF
jgi:hypothetical protein